MSTFDTEGVPVMEPSGSPPPKRSPLPLWIVLVVLAIAGVGGGAFAWLHRGNQTADLAAARPVPPASVQAMPRPAAKQVLIPKTIIPKAIMPKTVTASNHSPALPPSSEISAPPDNQMSQLRRTFEQNGWSVYWLASKQEATAWKSEGKTGYEIRLIPGTRKATVLKTGGRNIILKKWTVDLPSKAVLRGHHVYTNSSALLNKVLTN